MGIRKEKRLGDIQENRNKLITLLFIFNYKSRKLASFYLSFS